MSSQNGCTDSKPNHLVQWLSDSVMVVRFRNEFAEPYKTNVVHCGLLVSHLHVELLGLTGTEHWYDPRYLVRLVV